MIWNPYASTIHGQPAQLGAAPPVLRVIGGEATAEQLGMAQATFARFCATARTSAAANPSEVGELPDGSPYRIWVAGVSAYMTIRVSQAGGTHFVSWPSLFDTSYLPLWERPVVDFPHDPLQDLPPKPEFNDPYPKIYLADVVYHDMVVDEYYSEVSDLGIVYDSYWWQVVTWVVVARTAHSILFERRYTGRRTHYKSNKEANQPGYFVYEQFPVVGSEGWTVGVISGVEYDWTEPNYPGNTVTGWLDDYSYTEAWRVAKAHNEGAWAAHLAAVEEWKRKEFEWRLAHNRWVILKASIELGRNGPYYPVIEIRKQARAQQVAAVRRHILQGVGDAHLTARLLSFPYSVGYRSIPPVGSGGSVVVGDVSGDSDISRTTTLHDAAPHTPVPDGDGGHLLRKDIMCPSCLFGWVANGSWTDGKRFAENHSADPMALVTPAGLSALAFRFDRAYFTTTRLVRDKSAGLVVDADAFVPPGTELTVVVFEYETEDPFVREETAKEWFWTSCPEMMWHDSIWLRDLGTYDDTPRWYTSIGNVRAVRVASVFRQVREDWQRWSTPQPVSFSHWQRDYRYILQRNIPPDVNRLPAAVVIAEGLHSAAYPVNLPPQGGGTSVVWSGDTVRIDAAKAHTWEPSAYDTPPEQLIYAALQITGKVKA